MSFVTTTANLLIGTGTLHCAIGLLVPELREPLYRSFRDISVTVSDVNEHYARECSFWFQFGGIMMIVQGLYIRSQNHLESPEWFGWTLCGLGLCGAMLMPASGFWLIFLQGIRLVWRSKNKMNLQVE